MLALYLDIEGTSNNSKIYAVLESLNDLNIDQRKIRLTRNLFKLVQNLFKLNNKDTKKVAYADDVLLFIKLIN